MPILTKIFWKKKNLHNKKNEFLTSIKDKIPNCSNISFVELINAKVRDNKRLRFIELQSFIEAGKPIEEDDIHIHSLYARSNILQYICRCPPISMTGHAFPLPPMIEQRRLSELDALQRVQEKEIETTRKYNTEHANLLEELRKAQSEYAKSTTGLSTLVFEKACLEVPVIVDKKTLSGGDWVFFFNKYVTLESNHPFSIPLDKWKCHNCSTSIIKQTDKSVHVKVELPMFPFMKQWKNNLSWFVELWLEQDGKIINKDKISSLEKDIGAQQATTKEKKKHLKRITQQAETVKTNLDKSLNLEKVSNQKIQILLLKEYSAKDIRDLLSYLPLLQQK